MQSSTFPQLSKKGSWADEATYSHADVASIIEYARVRAVRVMPEFGKMRSSLWNGFQRFHEIILWTEVPAHSGWGWGEPSVVACPLWDVGDMTHGDIQ